MGAESSIAVHRQQLETEIETERVRYFNANALRNPFKDLELYLLPFAIAVVSWLFAAVLDATCSTDYCEKTESGFRRIYGFILFALFVAMWRYCTSEYAHDVNHLKRFTVILC